MPLGKTERFWKTILQEFLLRSQFSSFEEARQRNTIWINYYNQRCPHQGIKGLCPANFNHSSVTDLLAENHVLHLNSPCYYAPYNGAIEHAQGEFKRILRKDQNQLISLKEFTLSAELASHDLNHMSRRRRQGATSCGLFYNSPRFSYSNRKRKEMFLWICERAADIMQQASKCIAQ